MSDMSGFEGFELSPQQKYIWALQEKYSNHYQSHAYISIEGDLDVQNLQASFEKIIKRFAIFRTTFYSGGPIKQPVQIVSNFNQLSQFVEWNYSDLSGLSQESQSDQVQVIKTQLLTTSFDLVTGPLLRLYLIKQTSYKYFLLVSVSALCGDEASLMIFVEQTINLYSAQIQGNSLESFDNEDLQYTQYCQWQAEIIEAELETEESFWSKQLKDQNVFNLPFERRENKSVIPQFRTSRLAIKLDSEIYHHLCDFAARNQTSFECILLACWQLLVARYNQGISTRIGVGFRGRDFDELQGLYGPLVKYLPIALPKSENDQPFTMFLQQISASYSDLNKHVDYFNWDLLNSAQKELSLWQYTPFLFDYDLASISPIYKAGIKLEVQELESAQTWFKLRLSGRFRDNSPDLNLFYDCDLYTLADVERLAQQFTTLLNSVLTHPEGPVGLQNMLSPFELKQILYTFNYPAKLTPPFELNLLHQLFEKQALANPQQVAIICDDEKVTYQELNERANKLAHLLLKYNIGPDQIVGIYLERGVGVVISLLAVLKAGGAYLPIDTAHPKNLIDYMLTTANVSIVITQESLQGKLQDLTGKLKILSVDATYEQALISQQNSANPLVNTLMPSNLAYLLFTSGSTGSPKGVAIEHRQILNYLYGITKCLDLPQHSGYAMVTTFAADLANTVIFPALTSGGILHIISPHQLANIPNLLEYIKVHKIACLKIVPSLLKVLFEDQLEKDWKWSIEKLVVGGELFSWDLLDKVSAVLPNSTIINHYGPTETTVGAISHNLKKTNNDYKFYRDHCASVPLGQPLENVQVYILDANLQPVPFYIRGEIYIGGANVGRGYFGQPDLTAEKFIPDIFNTQPGQRLYKTGDLGRFLPDGTIEFLGRLDSQIKLRGYRIELGQLEKLLNQHPAIDQALLKLEDREENQPFLIAYLKLRTSYDNEHNLTPESVKQYLREYLPEHMLPSRFVILKAFPLTSNGKLDLQQLAQSEKLILSNYYEEKYTAPSNDLEALLVEIWQIALHRTNLGIFDNFFEQGGDSLLAIKVISQIRDSLQIQIQPQTIFEAPTVAQLAQFLLSIETQPGILLTTATLFRKVQEMSDTEIQSLLNQTKGEMSA